MSKKQITIDVPDGLPDGWECVGYGKPDGDCMLHFQEGWRLSDGYTTSPVYLIARRAETAADWANRQPRLGALVVLGDQASIELHTDGVHVYRDGDGNKANIYAEECPVKHSGATIVPKSGKWVDA